MLATVRIIHRPDAYAALVKCLEYCVTDYDHNAYDPDWDNWDLRDVVERLCLNVIYQLVNKFGPGGLIKSKFVERWLAKEPWGETIQEKQDNFANYLQKFNKLSQILDTLFSDQEGRQGLVEANLVPADIETTFNTAGDVKMINVEGTAGQGLFNLFGEGVRRRREDQTAEDDQIRRRHREAMVLNDGTRPLERGDIIERER